MNLQALQKKIRVFKRIREASKDEIITVVNQFEIKGKLPTPWKYIDKGISLDLNDIIDVDTFLNSHHFYKDNPEYYRELKAEELWDEVLFTYNEVFYKMDSNHEDYDPDWEAYYADWDSQGNFKLYIAPEIEPKNYKQIKEDIVNFCKPKELIEANLD
jgi:hypothetical protein